MRYCDYHPDSAATYYCEHCDISTCDKCSNEDKHSETVCFECDGPLESLGTGFAAEPFWRRLDSTFRYGLNPEVLIFISIIAVLNSILSFVPFSWLLQLMLTGAFFKYCFVCLQNTAQGLMQPADITEGYQDGLKTLGQLLLVLIGIGGMCSLAFYLLGKNFGALISFALLCGLPAAIITLALSESVLEAINPFRLWGIVSAVGLPYGLLLAFIMVMFSSVAVISQIIGAEFGFVSMALQSFISNFYSVVMFHMMGYMIFQYQHKLGFVARNEDNTTIRSDIEKAKAKLNISLRRGDFDQVLEDYIKAIKAHPEDTSIAEQCFQYLSASSNTEHLDEFGSFYLELLMKNKREDQMRPTYKRVLQSLPKFMPDMPEIRFALAKQLYHIGDHKHAIRLLNGLHNTFPDFKELPAAYTLLADILDGIDKKPEAEKFRNYSISLEKKRKQKAATNKTTHSKEKIDNSKPGGNAPVEFGGLSLVPKD